jgi:heat shock protein HtpX
MGGTLRTAGLFLVLTAMLVGVGFVLGGIFVDDPLVGALIFLVIAALFNFIPFFWGDKLVLKAYRAKIVTREEAPRLYGITERLALRADIPMPKVAIIPTHNPNAFATGRNPRNATVAATVGILQLLDDEELEAVMAHELSHVTNRDVLAVTSAATIAGAIAFAARMFFWGTLFGGNRGMSGPQLAAALLIAITAPIAALLVQLAVSRTREYKADASGAKLCGKPYALARALEKLEYGNARVPLKDGNPAHASLFIANPFRGGGFGRMFSTHPPTAKRVARLRKML